MHSPPGVHPAPQTARFQPPAPQPIGVLTPHRVNGQPFLEAAAVGLFGEAIALGEAAKDRHFGDLRKTFGRVSKAKPFDYELAGDITGEGTALSLVFANTPSMGANLAIGDATPVEPYLELAVHVGESRSDIVGRIVASTLRRDHDDSKLGMRFRFRKLRVTAKPRVPIFADNAEVGRTPADVVADVGALHVLLPVAARGRAKKAAL
jgi:diacylglycerol kinase family enzyme